MHGIIMIMTTIKMQHVTLEVIKILMFMYVLQSADCIVQTEDRNVCQSANC